MLILTCENGHLPSSFDKINRTGAGIDVSSMSEIPIDNQIADANNGKVSGQLPLENILGFGETSKKATERLGFRINFKAADFQDVTKKL